MIHGRTADPFEFAGKYSLRSRTKVVVGLADLMGGEDFARLRKFVSANYCIPATNTH